MNLRRYLQAGAVWAFPLGNQPLQEARSRYAVTGNPTQGAGPWGPFLSFDPSADYITLTAAQEHLLRFDSGALDFSVCAWVRRGATGANQVIFSKEDGANDGWDLRFRTTDAIQFQLNADSAGGPALITDDDWHCIVGVVDRSASLLVYVAGVVGAGVAIAGPAMATTSVPRMGARSFDASEKYEGDIAGVFVIGRVLSAAECLGLATGEAF